MDDEGQDNDPDAELKASLAALRQAHADLDAAVRALEALPQPDQLRVARLKKQKLVLRDQIAHIDSRLTPDIIA